MKNSQPQLEEELMICLIKLMEKKTSKIFREPVDATQVPDYYQRIKNPIDLSTIMGKIKQGKYNYAREVTHMQSLRYKLLIFKVRADLALLIKNCKQYNIHFQMHKTAEKFERSIQTEWTNFQKECQKKNIDPNAHLTIDEDIYKRLTQIQEKSLNRKPSNLQINLIQIDKRAAQEVRVLPPLPFQKLIAQDEDLLPKSLEYNPLKYAHMRQDQKRHLLSISLSKDFISRSFEVTAAKKLEKYRKILKTKLMWIHDNIIAKCLERKRFKKMLTPAHLASSVENGQIGQQLQLRKIQMWVKQVAYWVEEYPRILSYGMKGRFVQCCKAIRRCLFRVLRYRKSQKSTKIHLGLALEDGTQSIGQFLALPNANSAQNQNHGEVIPDDELPGYQNKMKEFKRMLNRDQGQTIKKYTKIMIRNENGEFTIIDWNLQNMQKKLKARTANVVGKLEHTEEATKMEKELERKEEKEKDIGFLEQFKTNLTAEYIVAYGSKMKIDWDTILFKNQNIAVAPDEQTTSL